MVIEFFLQSAGLHLNLSVHPNQPFRLGLLRNLLQLMQDSDIGLIDIAESGFHTGVFEPIRFSGIWRRQQTEAREDLPLKIYDTKWKPAEEDPNTVSPLIKRTSTPISLRSSTVTSLKPQNVGQKRWQLAASTSPGRTSATHTSAFGQYDTECQRESPDPCVEDIVSAKVVSHSSEGVGLTRDVSKAHKRLRIREDERVLLLF